MLKQQYFQAYRQNRKVFVVKCVGESCIAQPHLFFMHFSTHEIPNSLSVIRWLKKEMFLVITPPPACFALFQNVLKNVLKASGRRQPNPKTFTIIQEVSALCLFYIFSKYLISLVRKKSAPKISVEYSPTVILLAFQYSCFVTHHSDLCIAVHFC